MGRQARRRRRHLLPDREGRSASAPPAMRRSRSTSTARSAPSRTVKASRSRETWAASRPSPATRSSSSATGCRFRPPNIDDYANVDPKGKVIVYLGLGPKTLPTGSARLLAARSRSAIDKGAIAVIAPPGGFGFGGGRGRGAGGVTPSAPGAAALLLHLTLPVRQVPQVRRRR